MRLMSTTERFGGIAIAFHWLSAALIVALIASGFRAAGTLDPAAKVMILRVHALLGVSLLLLTLARIAWWWVDRRPAPIAATSRKQERAAKVIHCLFYIVIIGMAATGIGTLVLSGAGARLFGSATGALPDFWHYQPRIEHAIGARLLLGLCVIHIGAALYHQFVRRDRLIRRMLPARS